MSKVDEENITSGIVFDIRRFSVHDGPGIRTAVFLKGCPLHCLWCHNPEGISFSPEILRRTERCVDCRKERLQITGAKARFALFAICFVKTGGEDQDAVVVLIKDVANGPVAFDEGAQCRNRFTAPPRQRNEGNW